MRISLNSALFLTLLLLPSFARAETFTGIPHVVDGDTIRFGDVSIRLDAIDAPETSQTCHAKQGGKWNCGTEASNRLQELVAAGVSCESNKMDLYRRYLATCVNSDGVNINRAMVAEGFAWAFRRYSNDYAAVEDQAHQQAIGVWQAKTMAPWEFRKGAWDRETGTTVAATRNKAEAKTCVIKGNINNKGEHIYHMPWSRWYNKVQIDTNKGERWFCNEGEAVAAGWRAAGSH